MSHNIIFFGGGHFIGTSGRIGECVAHCSTMSPQNNQRPRIQQKVELMNCLPELQQCCRPLPLSSSNQPPAIHTRILRLHGGLDNVDGGAEKAAGVQRIKYYTAVLLTYKERIAGAPTTTSKFSVVLYVLFRMCCLPAIGGGLNAGESNGYRIRLK